MKDRNAVSTLKGYFYQFDFSILQLLNLANMMDKVTIKGMEDVDITTIDDKLAIQCKYYGGTEYNHSKISEVIKFLLIDDSTYWNAVWLFFVLLGGFIFLLGMKLLEQRKG